MAPSPRITSRQNQHVKDAMLLRLARERRRQRRFIIDGAREINRALAAGIHPLAAFACDELCKSSDANEARVAIEASEAQLYQVSLEVYAKLAFGDRNDGLIVVAEAPQRSLDDVQLPARPLLAVLEGIEKPGNLGAILRSADAAGVDAVIVADGRTDLYNPNAIRASLGTVFRRNICEASSADTIKWLHGHELSIIVARPDAAILYSDIDLRGSVAIVLGSEAAGLSGLWSASIATPVRLPMRGVADSLNVSTSAAILFYEALRQRISIEKQP